MLCHGTTRVQCTLSSTRLSLQSRSLTSPHISFFSRSASMGKRYYAVLRGRQPGVYNSLMSVEAQVRGVTASFHRGFDSRQQAQAWLLSASGQQYPYYEAHLSITVTHRISPRYEAPSERSIFLLQCDGASRGNPGPSGCGGCIWRHEDGEDGYNRLMVDYQLFLGHQTSNVAEYSALIRGLTLALGMGMRALRVQTDSELVVNQSRGEWTAQQATMAWYRDHVQALLHEFDWWELTAIRRGYNEMADQLANTAIDVQSNGDVRFRPAQVGNLEGIATSVRSRFLQCGFSLRMLS